MSYDANTAWLADQPASLAGLQIRLKTVKHKSLTRCPAFGHTATPQQATHLDKQFFSSRPIFTSEYELRWRIVFLCLVTARNLSSTLAIRVSWRKCHHSLRDIVWNTVAGYDVGKPRRDPTSHPKLIARAQQRARRSRIRLRYRGFHHGRTAASHEQVRPAKQLVS
ncbi:uncharacterized protein CC84DRAFT_865052 [Paraphaeosphaeria sporulosa]|uniref:Uncharacterized protein n=1 Tax=Paraphaeosphaeria sporulosa TaxID=1460663 RepID=A0A177C7J7_9PLEO|nr:uncharacterized protein CC84DRAFT_865052 [Paraphaeosphaeria sporulosa]OAG03724.1 hypothetical protein CC84DRAFT_865052 [Paraphaeosphaeria sporulosa]